MWRADKEGSTSDFSVVNVSDHATRSAARGAEGCEACLKVGDTWVHLRLCLTCGRVGCCDDSKNKHATKHYHTSKHPVIRSFEPGEHWRYCYPDDLGVDT